MVEPRKIFGGLGNRLFQMAYMHAQVAKGEIPDIYIQDPQYFEEAKDTIKELYSVGIEPIDMVSLHVRRGDYVGNSFYVDLTKVGYYEEAIKHFPDEKFLVFCADRQGNDDFDRRWVQNWLNEKGIDYEMWEGESEVDDLNAMAGCKGHIMANSSFSWWAAYLGGCKTVCPSRWFNDGVQRVGLLEEWIVL